MATPSPPPADKGPKPALKPPTLRQTGQGTRLTRAIVAVAIVLVVAAGVIFAIHAQATRQAQSRQASHTVAVLAALLAEQAGRIFDVANLLGYRARALAAERDWGDVERMEGSYREFVRLVAEFKYVSAIWLIDADGMPRLSSRAFPAPRTNLADREYFRVQQRDRQIGTFVSSMMQSRFVDEFVLIVSQRIEDRNGAFRGVAVVVLDPTHFLRLYESARVEFPVTIDLVRDDGALLIRSAASDPSGLRPSVEQVGKPPPAERFNAGVSLAVDDATGTARTQGLKRVRGFPIYAAVSVSEADVTARWLREIRFHALLAALTLLAVVAALAAVRHFGRRESRALLELRHENAVLEERVRDRSQAIERMIAEVKHRVKNSLQLAASLMHLQRGRQIEAAFREPLGMAYARILAIGRVHQQLHQAGGFDSIDLESYLTKLAHDVATTMAPPDRMPQLTLNIPAVAVRLDLAMPLALILTELVTNAVKHGRSDRPATVGIGLAIEKDVARLMVEDCGGGFPPAFDPGKSAGLGMHVLRGLTGQIDGRLKIGNSAVGARIEVVFPLAGVTVAAASRGSAAA